IRNNQSKLKVDKYNNLSKPTNERQNEGSQKGKWFMLSSTFIGGRRFMNQLYFYGMPICGHVRFSNIFLTFTCNLKWPEISKVLSTLKLTSLDCPLYLQEFS
ncbi:hypothetical protein V8G54_005076, partial [Vigna mungo]